MKKILSCLLAVLLLLSLFSCGEKTPDPQPEPKKDPEPIVKTDPVVKKQESAADIYEVFAQKTFTGSNGLTMPYRLYVPADYDAEKYTYPVLLFLHGAGERGDDNTLQLKNAMQLLFDDVESPIYECIVIAPQCAEGNQWVDTPWADGNYLMSLLDESKSNECALELLASVEKDYSVNAARRYVMGLSMGGFGTWDMLMRHSEMFAAGIPICGGADPDCAFEVVDTPIYTFHGTEDTTVPFAGTRDMVQAIRDEGGELVNFVAAEGYGHLVWDYAVQYDGLTSWLFSQKK